jgi:hypothetical protein
LPISSLSRWNGLVDHNRERRPGCAASSFQVACVGSVLVAIL